MHCHLRPSLLQGHLLGMSPHLTRHTWAWAGTHWPRLSSHDVCSQLINVNVSKTDIGSPLTARHHLAWLLLLLLSFFLLQQVLDQEWLLLRIPALKLCQVNILIMWLQYRYGFKIAFHAKIFSQMRLRKILCLITRRMPI